LRYLFVFGAGVFSSFVICSSIGFSELYSFIFTHCLLTECNCECGDSTVYVVCGKYEPNPLWVAFTYHIEYHDYEVSSLLDLCICVVLVVAFHHWRRVTINIFDDVISFHPLWHLCCSFWFYHLCNVCWSVGLII
jgi:hypothetical protein